MLRILSIALLFAAVSLTFSEDIVDKVKQTGKDVTSTKDSSIACMSGKCPEASIFHYYRCCGGAVDMAECCMNLQTWLIVVLAVIAVILLASFIASVVRCICCRR